MSKRIIYISGDGKSGSTLLDIVLGSQDRYFSAGEVRFFPEKFLENKELCSCREKIAECMVWKEVYTEWQKKRTLDSKSYLKTQRELLSMAKYLKTIKLIKSRPAHITRFIKDTQELYSAIFKVTNCDTIIDSSKAPGMIPVLKELGFNLTVIHLTRRFGDVLNSNKKHVKKNIEAGVEYEIRPSNTAKGLGVWLTKNHLTRLHSKKIDYKRVKYEEYIDDLYGVINSVVECDDEFNKKLENRGPFRANHMVAGNAIRLKNELFVAKKPMNTSYERLGGADRFLAKVVDAFY